jgi:hypothetical protein
MIPFGMLTTPPVAIVRSNTDGFFELPLGVGEYTYMVLLPDGFYIDMYISSRWPGQVEVFPDKVTELSIHVIDCSMWM